MSTSPPRPDLIVEEFWLNANLEVDSPDFLKERTNVKAYLKWALHKPAFFKKYDDMKATKYKVRRCNPQRMMTT